MVNLKDRIGDNQLALVHIKTDGLTDPFALVKQSDLSSVSLLSNTRFNTDCDSTEIKSVCLDEKNITPVIKKDGKTDAVMLKKLGDLISELRQNYIIIEEGENLVELPINITAVEYGTQVSLLLTSLRSLVTSLNANAVGGVALFTLVLMTRSRQFYEAFKTVSDTVAGTTAIEIEQPADSGITLRIATDNVWDMMKPADKQNEPKPPVTGVVRVDEILRRNTANWGDMIFYSSSDTPSLVRYALLASIPSAPIKAELCIISPFVGAKEMSSLLSRINEAYKTITKRAVERTMIVTAEDFRGLKLDEPKALMNTVYRHIERFRKTIEQQDKDEGICIIDTTGIDKYGAEIDHPSLRWYAKSNNLLIIVGADSAEERYTFVRTKQTQIAQKNAQNNALPSQTSPAR